MSTTEGTNAKVPKTMHGLQIVKYGSPSQSFFYNESIPTPKITKPTQILIRVKAAGINPIESKVASGNLKAASFLMSLPCVLGADYAGIVVDVGSDITAYKSGDEVFGTLALPFGLNGTHAQYTIVDTNYNIASIAMKPSHLSFEQAASAGIAVLAAYQGIVNSGNATPQDSRKILVVGASGGVGSYGIQVAKAINKDNHVVGICSDVNEEFVLSLGADRVIDYKDNATFEQFLLESKNSFDVVFDCVGGDDYYNKLGVVLKPNTGVYSTAVGPVQHMGSQQVGLFAFFKFVFKIAYRLVFASSHYYKPIFGLPHADFAPKIAPLFEKELINGTVVNSENMIPLKEGCRAYEKLDSHRTIGKIVLVID